MEPPVQPVCMPASDPELKRPKLLSYKAAVVLQPAAVALSPREEINQYLSCVVASGSPVERVFSVAGSLFSPRRSRMRAKVLSNLVFLKCNADLIWTVPCFRVLTTWAAQCIVILSIFVCVIKLYSLPNILIMWGVPWRASKIIMFGLKDSNRTRT